MRKTKDEEVEGGWWWQGGAWLSQPPSKFTHAQDYRVTIYKKPNQN